MGELSSIEKAILNFYKWDEKGRGYLLYPYQVDLEPTFKPFFHFLERAEYVDDGKVPTLFERIFPRNIEVQEVEEEEEKAPDMCGYEIGLRQFRISFQEKQDLNIVSTKEVLNMLSDTKVPVSFEIIGKHNSIEIQIVCGRKEYDRVSTLFKAYFPNAIINEIVEMELPFNTEKEILLVDFGYDEEFIRPIKIDVKTDPLTSIIAVLDRLKANEVVMFQILFIGIEKPWVNSILNSVSIGGQEFFSDSPEMLICAKEKVSAPLFAVVIRLAIQGQYPQYSESIGYELIQNIQNASRSEYNSLRPLYNEGYDYQTHLRNLRTRKSNRFGMIMNSNELFSFIHFPTSSSYKLIGNVVKTKIVPNSLIGNDYLIGVNRHLNNDLKVTLNDEQRLRHTHIIGATGTGKSNFISNLFLEDVKKGNGCAMFDPHGDTIEEIINHIPKNRLKDVVLIDPSDSEYSFSFNLLSANSEVEKIVLSSDLVEAFKRHSTSWGDQMTSVLSNAINVFLDSEKGGTLIELKRFLIENTFQKEFLKSVNDRSLHYYWSNEFTLLKKGSLSPLLTRLDTFLRPKIIRYILSQNQGIDFSEILRERKILLIKLSQGLIGEENSYLLGTMFLSKIHQVAQNRQSLPPKDRSPFYIYLDEFQNFITPSITSILSGARKYGIGLVLAHQELSQIKDAEIGNSVLSNANIRICFRLGDFDAKKLESGFSYFDSSDLQNLNVGQAICRVGRNTDDFSLNTFLLEEVKDNENQKFIIENTRLKYSKPISEIVDILNNLLPNIEERKYIKKVPEQNIEVEKEEIKVKEILEENIVKNELPVNNSIAESGKEYIKHFTNQEEIREHRYLQTFIKKMAEQRGFKATIEESIENGRVDVSLIKDSIKIACEIAVSNSVEYEIKNIKKCLNANYSFVYVISKNETHLEKIQEEAKIAVEKEEYIRISFLAPNEINNLLNDFVVKEEKEDKRIKGYRVKVNYIAVDTKETD